MRWLAVALLLGACRVPPLDSAGEAPPAPPRLTGHEFDVERRSAIVFAQPERGPALRLDLYVPECAGPHPFAVVVPGGGWRTGDRHQFDSVTLARALAEEGVAAASIAHRRAPYSAFPAPLEDCRAAVSHLVAHAGELDLDAERYCTVGCSSGGHLAAMLGVAADPARDVPRPRCVVALSAPLDFENHPAEAITGLQIKLLVELLGVDPARVRDLGVQGFLDHVEDEARAASPIHHVDAGDPPFLLVHGEDDTVVPVGHSRRMHRALIAAGVPSTLVVEPAGGHVGYFIAVGPRRWHGPEAPLFWRETRRILAQRLLP